MRKAWPIVVLFVVALSVAACGGSAMKLSTNPQLRKAQGIVQSCVSKGNLLTKSGRQGIIACVAPKKDKAKVESCIQNDIAHGKYFTKGERAAVEQKIATCVVNR